MEALDPRVGGGAGPARIPSPRREGGALALGASGRPFPRMESEPVVWARVRLAAARPCARRAVCAPRDEPRSSFQAPSACPLPPLEMGRVGESAGRQASAPSLASPPRALLGRTSP